MTIVVGGSGRKAGKTSVIECLIRALPEAAWLAVKISGHAHGAAAWELSRQTVPDAGSDTGRFLAAGAREAWWLRAGEGLSSEAAADLRSLMSNFENVLIESNSILEFLAPDLYLFVEGGKEKNSSARWRPRADAVIAAELEGACAEAVKLVAARFARQARPANGG